MSELDGKGSGSSPVAATADWNLRFQTLGTLLVGDGYGNVAGSGINLKSITMTLTSAQLLALAETPVLIIPPNGGIILPVSGFCQYHAGSTPYTVPANCYIVFGYPQMAGSYSYAAYVYVEPGIDQTTDQQLPISAEGYAAVPLGTLVNQPLVAFTYGFGDVTAGNGTLDVTLLYYTVVPNAIP